jgi:hypothetical protein
MRETYVEPWLGEPFVVCHLWGIRGSHDLLKSFTQLEKLDSMDLFVGVNLRITCCDLVGYRDG